MAVNKQSFAADVREWAERTKEAQENVMRESVQDVIELATRPQVALSRGATTVLRGFLPVADGDLQNTMASNLNGSDFFTIGEKGTEFSLTIQQMKAGDIANFAWTAAHALSIELGWGTYPGAHFVGSAAENWSRIVEENAELFKI